MTGATPIFDRLLPRHVDNRFGGYRAALWFLGAFIVLKLVMSVRSILDTASVVTGDGIPLGSYGPAAAQQVLLLFALMALGQLMLALTALAVLIRYRSLVPAICLLLLCERIASRLIILGHPGAGGANPVVWIMALALPALLLIALILSLLTPRGRAVR